MEKKCSYRPIKSQLEMLGFDLSKDTKKFDLSSDFTKDVDSLAEKYSKEDPEYVSATKKVDEYLSATKNLNDQIDHVEELRYKWKALENRIPELAPSEKNQYKNDPALAKAIKERDALGIEINKLSKKILTESKPFLKGDLFNYCPVQKFGREGDTKYYAAFERSQRKLSLALDRFFPPENRLRPKNYEYPAFRPQIEFCRNIDNALVYIAKVSKKSRVQAFDTVMKPLTNSPHGSQFVALFEYQKAAPFDYVEKVSTKDGRSLWLVKYRGEIKTAYLINDENKDQISAKELLMSPTYCTLSVGEWKLDSSGRPNLSYEINGDLCQAVREETKLSPFAWNLYDEYDSVSRQAACSEQGGNTVGNKCVCPKSNKRIQPDSDTCLEERKITPAIKLSERIWATKTRNYNLYSFKENKEQIFKSCDTHFPSQTSSPVKSGTPSGYR